MDEQSTILVIGAVLILVLVFGTLFYLRARRTRRLRTHFGPEYENTVLAKGRSKAEADLRARQKHADKLTIRSLTPSERDFYLSSWTKIQAQFVDDPAGSVSQADQLIGVVMSTCGYSVADFEMRAAEVSVDHPRVVEHYRAGHAIAERHARGQASTEELRQAMIHYRTLFDELVGMPDQLRAKLAS